MSAECDVCGSDLAFDLTCQLCIARTRVEELERHNDRLHRRLEQGTDFAALKGQANHSRARAELYRRKIGRLQDRISRTRRGLVAWEGFRERVLDEIARLQEGDARDFAEAGRLSAMVVEFDQEFHAVSRSVGPAEGEH